MKPVFFQPGVHFFHTPFLLAVRDELAAEAGADDISDEQVGEEYARRLKSTLDADLTATEADAWPRYPGEAGGPGVDFDQVRLILESATAAAMSYAAWKVLAQDLRTLIRRLASLSESRVLIDEPAAIVLAVDAVVTQEAFDLVSILFVAPLQVIGDMGPVTRAYLVVIQLPAQLEIVAVHQDGRIGGIAHLSEGIDFAQLGL